MKVGIVTGTLIAALAISVHLSAQQRNNQGTLVEFDPPGTTTVSSPACSGPPTSCGAFPYASNNSGEIVGWYSDSNVVPHGFLRSRDGTFVSFDAPGAGLGAGLNQGTVATAINDRGDVTGQFTDPNNILHGYVRYRDGSFAVFDAPGAGTGTYQGTEGLGINPRGDVVGYYIDANNVAHGLVRARDGVITSFDAPGAGAGPFQGTYTTEKSINPAGLIDGYYADSNYVPHGFVRALDGSITTFDVGGPDGTIPGGINPEGAVTGSYFTGSGGAFIRYRDGSVTTFSAPGGDFGTDAFSINAREAITGVSIDSSFVLHGFVRTPQGSYITLTAPGAGMGFAQGTRPEFISDTGLVVGYFYDANDVAHGFFWMP